MYNLSSDFKTIINSMFDIKADIKPLKRLHNQLNEFSITAEKALENDELNRNEINTLKVELCAANDAIQTLQASQDNLKDRVMQQDAYSRKDNLLFANIKEVTDEICEQLIRTVLANNLERDKGWIAQIKFVHCHRIGKRKQKNYKRTHPIIWRTHFYKDHQGVWK